MNSVHNFLFLLVLTVLFSTLLVTRISGTGSDKKRRKNLLNDEKLAKIIDLRISNLHIIKILRKQTEAGGSRHGVSKYK